MLCRLWIAAACCCAASAHLDAAETTLRLRVAWGGGRECQWQGSMRMTSGELSQLQPLGVEADETGSMWLEDGAVVLRSASGRTYDGVDLLVTADLQAKLQVTLSSVDSKEPPTPVDIPLTELISGAHSAVLDQNGNRLLVARKPGDALRVHFERSSLVFTPGEEFAFEVEPHLVGSSAASALRLRMQLSGATGRAWSQDVDVRSGDGEADSPRAKTSIKLPDGEGVYELHIAAINTRLRERLPWKKPLAERSVQLVVITSKPAPTADAAPLGKVLEIDPANPRWWDRLGNIPLMPGMRKGPLGNGDAARWDHAKLGAMIQLGGGNKTSDVSWEAYPLPLGNPGQPHILEIEYPSDVPQTMGISLLEPNAAGAVLPLSLDSGVYVSDEEADNPAVLAKHRLVFWPRTKTPLLLITNRRQASRAVYGKIRVLSAPHSQFAAIANLGRQAASPNVLPRAIAGVDGRNGRLLAGYLERPLLCKNFSAAEALDPASGRSLDDWTTFYQGSSRLVEYLHYAGYNGLMLSVLADGSSIYPSTQVEPTPRYDSGVFFASGQDPIRKDVLEMIFRQFDRDGLQLIPAIHFSTPLPELETLRRQQGDDAVGLEWIGVEGRSWTEVHGARQGLAPYYNPLDSRVQSAMLGVVRELARRYGAHPAFAGVALQLSAEGYAQLPSDGGYDDRTIADFEKASGLKVPGEGPRRFVARAKYLNGPGSHAWLAWRADTLARFHRQVQKEIVAAHTGAKLYLAGATMFDDPQLQRSLRPALPRRLKVDDVMLTMGLRPASYPEKSGIVLVRPQRLAPLGSLPARGVDLELNAAPEVDRLFAGSAPAGLFYHEPQRVRLASFDAKSPFGAANTFTSLVSELSPSGDRNRRRFVHSLATLDAQMMFDGGWLLPLGQEESLRDLVSVYRQLPAAPFETLAGDIQPVTIRTRVENGQTYVYLVNDSPWSTKVTLDVEASDGCKMEKIGTSRGVSPLVRTASGTTWSISLRPYDLAGARLSEAKVRLLHPRTSLNETVQVALQTRIQDLGARAAALGSPAPLATLQNADFETASDSGQVIGWRATATGPNAAEGKAPQPEVQAQLDTREKHGGQHSLHFTNSAQRAMLRSEPIEPPQTGRLSVALWLRVADPKRQPTVRMAIEGSVEGTPYYRFAAVGGTGPGAIALTTRWSQYIFAVDDLPSEGLSDLRVRFELIAPGEVWIDDVQLFDLAFSENERVELTKIITLANFKLAAGQIGDCARLLDGYWPQFLVANVPLTQGPTSVAQRPRTSAAPPPARAPVAPPVEEKPGVLDRMRGYVPKWW